MEAIMKQPLEITIDGKLVEKFKPKKRNRGYRVPKKRVRELYSKEKPEWLFGRFEEFQELSKKKLSGK